MPYPADYFAVSQERKTDRRCPLLQRCGRRAQTIALANRWPLETAAERVGLKAPIVAPIGEGPYQIGGESAFISGGLCPEVNLFERTVALPGFSGQPTTRGEYDQYIDPQYKVLEFGHFSQCAEYEAERRKDPQFGGGGNAWWKKNYRWAIATLIAVAAKIAALLK